MKVVRLLLAAVLCALVALPAGADEETANRGAGTADSRAEAGPSTTTGTSGGTTTAADAGAGTRAEAAADQGEGATAEAGIAFMVETDAGLQVRRLPASDPDVTDEALRRLRQSDHVLAAERDVPVEALGDPLRDFQWGLDRLKADDAWKIGDASGQKVAVVDTGVDAEHPDLAGVVLPGFDAFSDGDGREDSNGHGTHVAGIVAAVAGNDVGVEGLAKGAKILPVKVLEDDGSGFSSDVAEGILWAVGNGASVINLSLGSPESSSVVDQAVRQAVEQGVLVVAASGNEGGDGNPVMYPAALPETVAVGAIDDGDQRADFSGHGDWLDLVAPGVQIASTMGGQYMYSSGTSMAAPFVSATAAMVRKRYPSLTPAQLADHLRATADDLGPAGKDDEFGHGLIDPVAALGTTPGGTALQNTAGAITPVGADVNLVKAAAQVSQASFSAGGSASSAVLARDDAFADSLAGAALAGTRGPILYTTGGLDAPLRAETATELRRVLAPGSTVHVLGGPGAVSERAVASVRALGFPVVRHQGASRVETALAIADAVTSAPTRVLLARADQWADAVTGGAYAAMAGVPLLLTQSDSLHPAVAAWLAAKRPAEVVLLGGESALSSRVAAAVPARVVRVAGATRAGTAVAVAKSLWGRRAGRAGDRFVAVDGFAGDSWSPALAASVLSARQAAPQLLVNGAAPSTVMPETEAYLNELGYGSGKSATAWLVGPRVGASTADRLGALLTQ